jgi:LmbE family N-acetylglucosaminyl deacetylase
MTVLVFAPHQDDEVLGCGGVMARHVRNGDSVHVVVVTRGVPDLFPPELIERTRGELRTALSLLGVTEARFLEFPAPRLDTIPRGELAEALQKAIYDIKAEVVYVPHRGDIHHDHQAVFEAALVAARPSKECPVRRLLAYETLSETEWAAPFADNAFIPNVFVDISDVLGLKLQAMSCYQTQLKDAPHPRSLAGLEALAHLRGFTIGVPAAEAFMLVRESIRNP